MVFSNWKLYCQLYADNSEIIRVIKDESSAGSLQRYIDSVTNLPKDWLLKLNSNKCKVMHLSNKNVRFKHFIDDFSTELRINLELSECEKDLL